MGTTRQASWSAWVRDRIANGPPILSRTRRRGVRKSCGICDWLRLFRNHRIMICVGYSASVDGTPRMTQGTK